MKADRLIFSRKDLLQEMSICSRTLRRWIQLGKFPPPDRIQGKKRFWKRETVVKWIDEPEVIS